MPTQITFNQLYIIGALIGFVLGLAPLILGFKKQNIKFGLVGFVLSIIVGIFLSLLGALPVSIIFSWLILRKPAETEPVEAEELGKNPVEHSGEDSQNSSGSENKVSGD